MAKIFNFARLADYNFYHLRHGKGALIVAVCIEDDEECKKRWEENQEVLYEKSRLAMKPLKQKILELQRKPVNSTQICDHQEHHQKIESEISLLRREMASLAHSKRPYFSAMQVAGFYTHNQSPDSKVQTRFDKITRIEESGTHVKITLEFLDRSASDNAYHLKIGVRDHNYTHVVKGRIKRIVPVEQVTFEMVDRL